MATILDSGQARLFDADDLTNWLGRSTPITDTKAIVVEQVVWGWLTTVLGVATRPEPVTASVFSWALELGGIAHENPAGLSVEQLGPAQRQFSAERRGEILAEAAAGGSTSVGSPRGSFPPARCYPDPAW